MHRQGKNEIKNALIFNSQIQKVKKEKKEKKGFIANKKNGIKCQKNEKKAIFQDLRL